MEACEHGNLETIKFLVSKGMNIHQKDINGQWCLIKACGSGYRLDIIEFLVSLGANINDKDNEGYTPLMYACIEKNIIKFLLSQGANINEIANNGNTCFSLGEDMGLNKILYLLRKWPTSMFIIILEQLGLEGFMDNSSLIDFHQYFGKEDFELDNEDDYEKDPNGNVINSQSDDEEDLDDLDD
jgi:hypothetical protein